MTTSMPSPTKRVTTRARVGPVLAVIAVVHFAATPLFYAEGVVAIIDHGVVNGVESGTTALDARAAALWYLASGLLMLPLTYLCWSLELRGERLPIPFGWILLGFTVATGALVPLGGFWLFLVPAAMVIAGRGPLGKPVNGRA